MPLPTGSNDSGQQPPRRKGGLPTGGQAQEQRPANIQKEANNTPQRPSNPPQQKRPPQRPPVSQQETSQSRRTPNEQAIKTQKPQVRPPMQREELYDDTFSDIPVDDVYQEADEFDFDAAADDFEEPVNVPVKNEVKAAPVQQVRARRGPALDDRIMPAPQDDNYDREFIDTKNAKLETFGKSKNKVKVSDFDGRKNLANKRSLYQYIVMGAVILLIGGGAYKVFMPADTVTPEEVIQLAAIQAGETGFPTQRGEAFAEGFIKSYLTLSDDTFLSENYAYFGKGFTKNFGNNTSQVILNGPILVDAKPLTASSASYRFAVLLNTSYTGEIADGSQDPTSVANWLSFNINLLYDEKEDVFSIPDKAPTVTPFEYTAASELNFPAVTLGTEIDADVSSTIYGFLDGYVLSSPTNHSKIDQYISSSADRTVYSGFDGKLTFAGDSAQSASNYSVYTENEANTVLKVLVKTELQNVVANGNVTYQSQYVITLELQPNNTYQVSRIAPYLHVTDEELRAGK